jgi:TolA-binding protein
MSHKRLFGGVVASLFVIIVAGQALGQVPLDDPLDDHSAKRLDRMEKALKEIRAIVFQGRETGQPVVVQPADTDSQMSRLSDRQNDLDQTLARLNGQVEILKHDLDLARQDVAELRAQNIALKEQFATLDQTVRAMTAPPPPPPPSSPDAGAANAPSADPAAAFAAAKTAMTSGDMTAAEAGFRDYVEHYGDGPRGPEARYYLAKTLLERRAWADAATADIGAIRGWPATRWAPDAVVDLARALTGLNKPGDACQTLDELARRYPKALPSVKTRAADIRAQAACS